MKRFFLLFGLVGLGWGVHPSGSLGQTAPTVAFQDIWKQVRRDSPAIRAAEYGLKAAGIEADRAGAHWYPRLYLDARAYATNDPAQSFMSLLEERRISVADFSPASLNQPADRFYERGALVLDFPLFEGGGKQAMADSARKMRDAKGWENASAQTGEYVQLAGNYASLLALRDEREGVEKLRTQVQAILEHYNIGSKSNPVGYSGLLGLKNLRNRLLGLEAQDQAQENALKTEIRLKAKDMPADWVPSSVGTVDFLDRSLPENSRLKPPPFVQAALSQAEAAEKMKAAKTAVLLPKVALFGEGTLNNGDRASATGYAAGVYLQWDLLDIPHFGAGDQAQAEADAAKAGAEVLRRQSSADWSQAQETQKALRTNLILMDDSSKLLEEQTETARNLFRDGSINALQLVEVLSRRADLISDRTQAELGLVRARASLAVNSGFQETSIEKQ